MKTRRRLTTILAALLFSMLPVGSIFAQDDPGGPPPPDTVQTEPSAQTQPSAQSQPNGPPPDSAPPDNGSGQANTDPPGRVARIEYMSGEVSMQPGGVNDWVAASQNRPLTTSDRVWTDKNSKTELSLGDAFVRMNSESSLTLSNVSDQTVQMELDQGTLELTVQHLEPGEIFEVDTPNAAFTVSKTGVYRFDVFPNEDKTWITVRKGQGEATGRGSVVKISSGQQVRFSSGTSLVHTSEAAPANDGFDDWARVRDERLKNSESARYVSPGVIGAQDLDQYGRWQQTPQYGAVWVPTSVPPGWAPYRYGHWAWIDPWGWTWVDDAPWGFAPFHYGRWVSYGGYWGWAPGPIGYYRPYYAPALVGWIGGPGFGIGFGGGGWGVGINFGWFALGFGEPFYPWYGGWGWGHGGWYHAGWGYGGYCSPRYFNRVNVTNTRINNFNSISNNYYHNNINNTHYANRSVNGAVTAAPKSAFTSGAAINRAGVAVPSSALRNASMMRTAAVSPTKASVLGGHAPTSHVPPASAFNRSVVTHNTPPARPSGFGAASSSMARTNTAPSSNTMAHTPNGQSAASARPGQPSVAAHNVPRPPSAGSNSNLGSTQANGNSQARTNQEARLNTPNAATHNVPRPPAANDSFARGNGANNANGANNTSHTAAAGGARQTTGASSASHGAAGTTTAQNVPRPPSNYSYSQQAHTGNTSQTGHPATNQSAPSQHQSAPAAHESAPSQHSSAPAGHESAPSHQSSPSHEGGQSKSEHQGSASMNVPRPPSGYSYHAAPTYTASAAYGSNRIGSSSYGSSGRSNSSYASNGSYGRSTGYGYGSSRSYPGAASSRAYSPSAAYGQSRGYSAPSYSSRSAAPSGYSASRSYGSSGGGGHYSGGGGGGHYSGGGGGHSGGGGGHRGR